MKQSKILLGLAYLPNVQHFTKLYAHSQVYIEAHEHYTKRSFRNRTQIVGANGIQRLSIPLEKGKNEQMPIGQVRISYDMPWQSQHWKSILSAYGKAPFFEFYADELIPFYKKKYDFLFDYNFEILQCLINLIGLDCTLNYTTAYIAEPIGVLDYRKLIYPKYVNDDIMYIPQFYNQVFEERHGFIPNMSVLDLLFCVGPAAIQVLANATK